MEEPESVERWSRAISWSKRARAETACAEDAQERLRTIGPMRPLAGVLLVARAGLASYVPHGRFRAAPLAIQPGRRQSPPPPLARSNLRSLPSGGLRNRKASP